MQSTLNPKPSDDPHDVVVVPPDVVRVAPSDQEISHLLQQAARFHSEAQARNETGLPAGPPVPPVDTTFRATAVNEMQASGNGPSIGRRVGRAFAALLLALCIGAAAIGWQTFGYAAKKMMVKWVPQFALSTSLPLEKLWPGAQPAPPAVEADAADAAPAQTAPSAQTAAPAQTATEGSATANATAPAVDPAKSLQSMARDLASVSQEVEQLKASIAELKAQQTAREAAKTAEQNRVAEQNARARIAALPPRPAVPRPHKPIAPYPPTQAYLPAQAYPSAQAYPPAAAPPVSQAATPYYPPRQPEPLPPAVDQLPPAPGFTSVPRPPMPVQ